MNKSSMPAISIITPCYNSSKYLIETVTSVLNQTYKDWEWLICDDLSTDDSLNILKSYKDERIVILENERNMGAAYSRNKALQQANGRYITFLDSDDIWFPNFLERGLQFLIDNNYPAIYASYQRKNELLNPYLDDFVASERIDYERVLKNCPIPMLTSIYDCKIIGKIKFPAVKQREDWAMWIDLLKKTDFVYPLSEALAIYRMREGSYSRNKKQILKLTFAMYRKHLKMSLPKALYYTSCWALNGVQKYWIGRKNKDK